MSYRSPIGEQAAPISELARIDPTCWYDIGKVVNESQLRIKALEDTEFGWVALRFALLFDAVGESKGDRAQFLPAFVSHYLQSGLFHLPRRFHSDRSGSSYSTSARLSSAFCDSVDVNVSGCLNIASGFVTWKELLETIRDVTGQAFRLVQEPHSEAYLLAGGRTELDCSAASSLFSRSVCEKTLREIVAETVEAVESNATKAEV